MDTTKAKKPQLVTNITVGERGRLSTDEIRTLAKNDPKGFMEKVDLAIKRGDLTLAKVQDLPGIFRALSDVQIPVVMDIGAGAQRSIMASAFPLFTGNLVVAAINMAYEAVPTIGEELVEDMEDSKRVTIIGSIHSLDTKVDSVKEADDFPEIGATAEKYEIRNKRNGRKLRITMEAIEENNIADIVNRVNALGEIAADAVEEQTLDRVTDRYGSAGSPAEPYVFRPDGVGTQLYNATANSPGERAPNGTRKATNALVDETDLEFARAILASMRNSRGKRIVIPMSRCLLVVPDALVGKASKILNSELVPGTENEINNWGPRGRYQPKLVSSPKLDDISTSDWYLGDFKRQFRRKWKLKFEYVTLAGDQQAFLDRRIAFQARVGWDVEVGAVDYVNVCQSQA